MGTADLAVLDDALAVNVNPASLTRNNGPVASGTLEVFNLFGQKHRDSNGNHTGVDKRLGAVAGAGFTTPLKDYENIWLGIGLFAQGGVGYVYQDLKTTAGTQDEISAVFGTYRIAPAAAWKVNENLSLGATLNINYSVADQKLFPNTENGLWLRDLSGISYSFKLAANYQIKPSLLLSAIYSSKTKLRLDDGKAQVNFGSSSLGKVEYHDVSVSGLALAAELGIGFLYQATDKWQISGESTWINHSAAMNESIVSISTPSTSSAPKTLSFANPLHWRDQFAVALGSKYCLTENTFVMNGFTYAPNPVPSKTLNPALPLISEFHIGSGILHNLSSTLQLTISILYSPANSVTYTNNTLPLGSNAKETAEFWDFQISFTKFL